MSPNHTAVKLVVVERGALPLASDLLDTDDGTELVILLEGEADEPLDFALSTLHRIARLERAGRQVRQVVISVSSGQRARALGARCLLARAVLVHQLQAGGGEIVFEAAPGTDASTQHELLSLVGVLSSELGQSQVGIRVRFGEAPPLAKAEWEPAAKSGIHAFMGDPPKAGRAS